MTKLRLKFGPLEVEYEGSDDFLVKEVPALLQSLVDIRGVEVAADHGEGAAAAAPTSRVRTPAPSTSTIAATIGAKSGSDLALAAAAALILGGSESFSRSELLSAMQGAKAYYKATYRSNLSSYITTLVKSQHLLDHGNDMFGLQIERRKELEGRLAQS